MRNLTVFSIWDDDGAAYKSFRSRESSGRKANSYILSAMEQPIVSCSLDCHMVSLEAAKGI